MTEKWRGTCNMDMCACSVDGHLGNGEKLAPPTTITKPNQTKPNPHVHHHHHHHHIILLLLAFSSSISNVCWTLPLLPNNSSATSSTFSYSSRSLGLAPAFRNRRCMKFGFGFRFGCGLGSEFHQCRLERFTTQIPPLCRSSVSSPPLPLASEPNLWWVFSLDIEVVQSWEATSKDWV